MIKWNINPPKFTESLQAHENLVETVLLKLGIRSSSALNTNIIFNATLVYDSEAGVVIVEMVPFPPSFEGFHKLH